MTDIARLDDQALLEKFLAAADEEVHEVDADEVSMDIIVRILQAQTVDDILGGGTATHAREYLDKPFTLTDVKFNRSSFDGAGPSMYAVLSGADPDGEKVTITCGARNVIAQAYKLREIDALPIAVKLGQSERPTRNGYHVMWLEAVPSF